MGNDNQHLSKIKIEIAKEGAKRLGAWVAASNPETKSQKDTFAKGAGYVTEWLLTHYGVELERLAYDFLIASGKAKAGIMAVEEFDDIHETMSEIWHKHR